MPKQVALPLSRYNNKRYRKKLSVWQREKEKKRAMKHTKLLIGSLVVFFTLVFAWHAIGFLKFFIDFFHFGATENVVNEGRTNLVVDFGQISLVSIDSENKTMFIANLSPEVYAELAQDGVYPEYHRGGEYRLTKAYELGEVAKKGAGGAMLMQSVQGLFDIPIDGYVKAKKPFGDKAITIEAVQENLGSTAFLLHFLRSRNFANHIATNLSAFDTLSLWWQVRGIRPDKVQSVVYNDASMYDQKELADGSKVLGVSEVAINQIVGEQFVDSLIAKENARVKIINASGKPGVASNMARLIINTGGEVIRVETDEQLQEKSKIIVNDEANAQRLMRRLSKLREFDIIASHGQYDDLSDVTIILGTD